MGVKYLSSGVYKELTPSRRRIMLWTSCDSCCNVLLFWCFPNSPIEVEHSLYGAYIELTPSRRCNVLWSSCDSRCTAWLKFGFLSSCSPAFWYRPMSVAWFTFFLRHLRMQTMSMVRKRANPENPTVSPTVRANVLVTDRSTYLRQAYWYCLYPRVIWNKVLGFHVIKWQSNCFCSMQLPTVSDVFFQKM